MDFKEDLDKINTELTDEQKSQVVQVALTPTNIVRTAVSNEVAKKVQTDDKVKERIDSSADKIVDTGLETIENEADSAKNKSNKDKLTTYFEEHKEELKTAGIDKATYIEDMERGVNWHRKWSNVHWRLFGWWQTGIRTFIQKAKPFKMWLNLIGILLSIGLTIGTIFGIVKLIQLFV